MTQTAVETAYKVDFVFCNGQEFSHPHRNVRDASREFGDLLTYAAEPERISEPAKHIAFIGFTKIADEALGPYSGFEIAVGPLPCEHFHQ